MNAGLLAVEILATTDERLQTKLVKWRAARRDEVLAQELEALGSALRTRFARE